MIPYATAAEAEGALGRPMTWAEAAWFRYSSATPDYGLHFHTVILLSVVYTLVPLPLALLELRTSAKQTSPPYKLQPRVRRTPADFIRCYKNTVRIVAPAAGALQLVSYPAVKVHTTSVLRRTSNNQLMSCRI
jgi:4,4-dimethyl-9beta,19-cyclopropylsterol-4alpha-methyl oxidase